MRKIFAHTVEITGDVTEKDGALMIAVQGQGLTAPPIRTLLLD